KLRLGGGEENVAGHGELEATGRGDAVDRADHRSFELQQRRYRVELEGAGRIGGGWAELVEIEPGAEGAPRAGEDEHAHRRVPPQLLERRHQLAAQFHRQRVELLPAVLRQPRVPRRMALQENRSIGMRHALRSGDVSNAGKPSRDSAAAKSFTPRTADRHIAPPATPGHARKRADSRTGRTASVPRTASRPGSGAA